MAYACGDLTLPAGDDLEAPANLAVWTGGFEEASLIDVETGSPVPMITAPDLAGVVNAQVYRPTALLDPALSYEVFGRALRILDADDVPPSVPSIVDTRDVHYRDDVGRWEFDGVAWTVDHDGALTAVRAVDSDELRVFQRTEVELGHLPCEGWPGDPYRRTELQFGAYDLAGNFSGWSEPVTAQTSRRGCETAPGSWVSAAVAGWLLAVRRLSRCSR